MKQVRWNGTQTQANNRYGLLLTFYGFVLLVTITLYHAYMHTFTTRFK